jgi:hypothetical protein
MKDFMVKLQALLAYEDPPGKNTAAEREVYKRHGKVPSRDQRRQNRKRVRAELMDGIADLIAKTTKEKRYR